MPTITGTITRKDGSPFVGFVRFTPWWQTPPDTFSDQTPITTVTSKAGALSQSLAIGYYRVEVGNNPSFLIQIPEDSAEDTVYELSTVVVGPNYMPSSGGAGGSFTVYYGKDDLTILTGAQALGTLTAKSTSTIVSTYSLAAGTGYIYFAWPETAGSPKAGTGFAIGSFNVPMATSGDGYDQTENGWAYKLVTIDGVSCRLYRTFNKVNGAVDIIVTK